MLLQAEWRGSLQCFVKQVNEEPDSHTFPALPVLSFELYDREGNEIVGRRRAQIIKDPRVRVPNVRTPATFNIPDNAGYFLTGSGLKRYDSRKATA